MTKGIIFIIIHTTIIGNLITIFVARNFRQTSSQNAPSSGVLSELIHFFLRKSINNLLSNSQWNFLYTLQKVIVLSLIYFSPSGAAFQVDHNQIQKIF